MRYTKKQILLASRCDYVRDVAKILGKVSWLDACRFVRSRLITGSLREANEIIRALGIRD